MAGIELRSTTFARLERLQRLMLKAEAANPEILPEATGVTVTQSDLAGVDASKTLTYGYSGTPELFDVQGCRAYLQGSRLWGVTNNTSPQNGQLSAISLTPPAINAGEATWGSWAIEFMTDDAAPVIGLEGDAPRRTRIAVDGQYVDVDGHPIGASTERYTQLTFAAGRKSRRIRVQVPSTSTFVSVKIGVGSRVWKPLGERASMVITGDSHHEDQQGVAAKEWLGKSAVLGQLLGVADVQKAAVGATGYISNNGGVRSTIRQQIPVWINQKSWDVIMFAGGYNDRSFTPSTVADEALLCWQLARASQPNAVIIGTGIPGAALGPGSQVIDLENALAAKFAAWADPLSAFVRVSTDTQPWNYGTGYEGATNGSGNSDIYVSSDGSHHNVAGHAAFAYREANAIRQAIAAL